MKNFRNVFIPDTPICAVDFFNGPLSWLITDKSQKAIKDQFITRAQYLNLEKRVVRVLSYDIQKKYENDFIEEINKYSIEVLRFSQDQIASEYRDRVYHAIRASFNDCDEKSTNTVARFALWLLSVRPRVLHIWHEDCLEVLMAAAIAGVPHIIFSAQNLSPLRRLEYEEVNERLSFFLLSNIMRLSGVNMTNNSFVGCRDYENWLGLLPGTVTYLPNVFDLSRWVMPADESVESLRRSLGVPERARVLGGMFDFHSVNDPELWVCTALRVCAARDDVYAVVSGEGLTVLKERIASSPLAERILFPGRIVNEEAFFSLCDVLLDTSHADGIPDAVLKAQASQVPVVATCSGGVSDFVVHEKSGFVIDEHDENVLTQYVIYILTHADFALQSGRLARERIEHLFAPEVVMPQLERLYDRILGAEEVDCVSRSTASAPRVEVIGERTPLVSIVLPTYNHLQFLPEAVESVLGQTYPNFELIIVNDGSTDGTITYLESLDSPRVKVLNGPNTRLPTALNRGFALSSGVYRTWTSADNICLPHLCEMLVRALQNTPEAGFATAPFARINSKGVIMDHLPGRVIRDSMFCQNGAGAAFMYSTAVARLVGDYEPSLEGAEDWDMWLRILDVTRPVYVPSLLYQYRWHDDSMRVRISEKVRQSSLRTAKRAIQRLEALGGIRVLYPQIAQCEDKKLALFHANLIFGSRMIESGSFLKEYAINYLARAHALYPDDLVTIGNYAVSLAYHGRYAEAEKLLSKGESMNRNAFALLRKHCIEQRPNAGKFYFSCPILRYPGPERSELLCCLKQSELTYSELDFRQGRTL